jgi:hypothetical protein
LAAYEALVNFGGHAAAADALRGAMKGEPLPVGERLTAARLFFRATGNADETVEAARSAIRRDAESRTGFQATREAEELVFWLGARAKPLAADLRHARDQIRGRDVVSARRRAALDKVISGIP